MSKRNISPELLKKYLDGKCNPEEIFLVDEWYFSLSQTNENSVTEEQFSQLRHLKNVESKIAEHTGRNPEVRPLRNSFSTKRFLFRLSVAAMLLLFSGLGFYYALNKEGFTFPAGIQPVSVLNKTRQVKTHRLPDGSTVSLNPNAKIRYNKRGFAEKIREVSLEGEAFFSVMKDAAHPFVVNGGEVLIKVLGTSFNVKATPGESQYQVSVVTGKVSVSVPEDQGKQITLLPNQQGVYKVSSGELISGEPVRMKEKVPAWHPVSLTFKDEKLGEVMRRLEEKFEVRITLANPDLENCRVKATFDNNRLSEILEMTTQIVEAKYQLQGDEIMITGKGCPNIN